MVEKGDFAQFSTQRRSEDERASNREIQEKGNIASLLSGSTITIFNSISDDQDAHGGSCLLFSLLAALQHLLGMSLALQLPKSPFY